MQAVKQVGVANPKVLSMRDVRPTLREQRDASVALERKLDSEIKRLMRERRQERERQEGLADLLGMSDDGRLAQVLSRHGWKIVD